jgi:hypothetical protein
MNLNFQADIHNLEAEIKECKAELQKATGARPIHLETVCGDSENGSEDDFVESTPKTEITPNQMWLVWQYTVCALLILCPSHHEMLCRDLKCYSSVCDDPYRRSLV